MSAAAANVRDLRIGGVDVAELVARIPEWQERVLFHERRAAAYREIILGVRLLNGEQPAANIYDQAQVSSLDPRRPRGTEAVLAVMGEDPERVWALKEIKTALLQRGWTPSVKAVDANMRRLRHAKQVGQTKYGLYVLPAKYEEMTGRKLLAAEVAK